jgi:hypothetical protein
MQGINEAMIYLGNINENSYISIAKPKNIFAFLTSKSEILVLFYRDFSIKSSSVDSDEVMM